MGDLRIDLVVVDDDGVLCFVLAGFLELFLEVEEAAANALAISAMVAVVLTEARGAADVKAGRFAAGWPGASSCNPTAAIALREAAAMSLVSLDRFLLLLSLWLLREPPGEEEEEAAAVLPPTLVRDPSARVGAVAAADRSSFTSSSRFLIRPSRKGWNV